MPADEDIFRHREEDRARKATERLEALQQSVAAKTTFASRMQVCAAPLHSQFCDPGVSCGRHAVRKLNAAILDMFGVQLCTWSRPRPQQVLQAELKGARVSAASAAVPLLTTGRAALVRTQTCTLLRRGRQRAVG